MSSPNETEKSGLAQPLTRHQIMLVLALSVGIANVSYFKGRSDAQHESSLSTSNNCDVRPESAKPVNEKPVQAVNCSTQEGEVRKLRGELQRNRGQLTSTLSWLRFTSKQLESPSAGEEVDAGICKIAEDERSLKEANTIIESLGITNLNDQEALKAAYQQGCEFGTVADGRILMSEKNRISCENIELEEAPGKEFVDPEKYSTASEVDRRVLNHFKNRAYEAAISEFDASVNEVDEIASGSEWRSEPAFATINAALKNIHTTAKNRSSYEAVCQVLSISTDLRANNEVRKFAEKYKEDGKLEAVEDKFSLLADLIIAKAKRDNPNVDFGDNEPTPALVQGCSERGIDMTQFVEKQKKQAKE